MTKALRAFWWVYWPIVVLYVAATLAVANGPRLQGAIAPTHADLTVTEVSRTPETLCWRYGGRKLRPAATDDIDAFLYSEGVPDRMVVAPYGEADGLPWRKSAAMKVGQFSKRYCLPLPPGVPDDKAVRFELTAYFPGPFGLWRYPMHWPPVAADGLRAVAAPPGR